MGARRKARKSALDILFESELRGLDTGGSLNQRQDASEAGLRDYTVEIVNGVIANREAIDALIAQYAAGWTIDRMPVVDRNLLRIAVFELRFAGQTVGDVGVPAPVVINEAVELATELSTDASPAFVNGVLSAIARAAPADVS